MPHAWKTTGYSSKQDAAVRRRLCEANALRSGFAAAYNTDNIDNIDNINNISTSTTRRSAPNVL
jgi:hypothetical protein